MSERFSLEAGVSNVDCRACDEILGEAVEHGDIAGAVVGAVNQKGDVYLRSAGRMSMDLPAPMENHSTFFIASMTKAVTAVAAMQLVEQRRLNLDEPLGHLVPYLEQVEVLEGFDAKGQPSLRPRRGSITLRHLLSHTAGFAYPYWNSDIERYLRVRNIPEILSYQESAIEVPLVSDPGRQWEYGFSMEFVGKVIESVSGTRLDHYFDENIFTPLGMSSTSYQPATQAASVHVRDEKGNLVPMNFSLPQNPTFFPGGVGLFSNVPDWLSLSRALLGKGGRGAWSLLQPETIALMAQMPATHAVVTPMRPALPFWSVDVDLFPGQAAFWGLGLMVNSRPAASGRQAGTLSWAGACNTYFWIDRASGVAGVFMSQSVPFCDPRVLDAARQYEASVYSMFG